MFDGLKAERVAVDDRFLVPRLNVLTPFSSTDGDIRFDQPLLMANYNGLFFKGKPHAALLDGPARYWFTMRGSLIKACNQGQHNTNALCPFGLLRLLDDLATSLRLDPFRTMLNGLELSATVQASHARQLCTNLLSYLNQRPNFQCIRRQGIYLPYAEVSCGQHTLKIYSPIQQALRIELKVEKMQYLGPQAPRYLADLTQPDSVVAMTSKLLKAFDKVMWHYPDADLTTLTPDTTELYLRGQQYTYWQVRRDHYQSKTDFHREEKRRQRDKVIFADLVRRFWTVEPPEVIRQRVIEQINRYLDIIHGGLYQTTHSLARERWHSAAQLSAIYQDRLGPLPIARRLWLSYPSEIYPLHFGRFQTFTTTPQDTTRCPGNKRWLSINDLRQNPHFITDLLQGAKAPQRHWLQPGPTDVERAWRRQRSRICNSPNRMLRRLKKMMNLPGGLLLSDDDLCLYLSANAQIALAYAKQTLPSLRQHKNHDLTELPLFANR